MGGADDVMEDAASRNLYLVGALVSHARLSAAECRHHEEFPVETALQASGKNHQIWKASFRRSGALSASRRASWQNRAARASADDQ
jgi:hypothetical protein